ncbi:ABC transporter ATP-binding protein [Aquibium sp. A9E412]|uniref:ABC transporter ATP-binding protein n=1 Tax=Aquibium sp. A9E412 TaxID=2976767 RepID=UPI0025AFDD3D|nr:ABC transporter ATP-binding protein [Aquibium sp. A9E412]MDN2565588.1 ABC transporter ATP-binding protein [Aquibium sp. A9E412]
MSAVSPDGATPLLQVEDLHVAFDTRQGAVTALDGVSFSLAAGETLGIVGESGCGKSITALALMGLIPAPPGRLTGGRIDFAGRDIARLAESELRRLRGRDIAMIFQEPMTSLNPVFPVGAQIAEAILLHREIDRQAARREAVALLRTVGIPDAERRATAYPHELSGGMRQRVMIAMAISCRPKVLIADEPTTALDVTVQAQIFELMRRIQDEFGVALMLITHDMGAIAEMADRVAVMYAGRIVEQGLADDVLDRPLHPYTRGLIDCIPVLGKAAPDGRPPALSEIPGVVPPLHLIGDGCAFADRCSLAEPRCRRERPPLTGRRHGVACHVTAAQAT